MNETKFPIGTKKAAELAECSKWTIIKYCKILEVSKLAGSRDYLIYKDQLEKIKNMMHKRPGRPLIFQEK